MKSQIVIVLFASFFVLLLLSFLINFILSYQKKVVSFRREKENMQIRFAQTLLQTQIEVQEATLSALAKELHDNVCQLLSSGKMLLGITKLNLHETPETLDAADQTLSEAINELRSLSKSLDKEWLQQFDMLENLKKEVDRINTSHHVKAHIEYDSKFELNPDKQIILYRIIQEALQNAIKHGRAKCIRVETRSIKNSIFVSIKDDGIGFNLAREGQGIRNMTQRTKILGGTITWRNLLPGTEVYIQIPVNEIE